MSDQRLNDGTGPRATLGANARRRSRRVARRALLWSGLAAGVFAAVVLWDATGERPREAQRSGPDIPTASPSPQLRVLYAGNPASPRTHDFATFLGPHFAAVEVADLATFRESDADGFDVVLIDWADAEPQPGPPPQIPAALRLSDGYSRPTILIGGAGGQLAGRLRLKMTWLCLCLGDAAHEIADGHELFHFPSAVPLVCEERPASELFRHWPVGPDPGPVIRVWQIQQRPAPDGDGFGLVCDPYGFEDSPDAEVIARGINSKNPRAVALARQANFFFWGFSARPSAMTPSGQACFLNAVHYIRRFDGARPLVRREADGRESALVRAGGLRDAGYRGTLRGLFPDELCDRLGHDLNGYVRYFQENLEFLRPVGDAFVADEEVVRVGPSNRRPELLETCVAMLERGENPDLARRILRRYTTEDFVDAGGWRRWLEASRTRLYFSDVGGYKFRVAPDPPVSR